VTDADRSESSFVQNVTAVDGFAYGVIGADLHVFPDRGPVYLLAEHHPEQEPDSGWLVAQPSRMLDARYAVVDFTGRSTEQAELTAWLYTGSRLAARWLHAPGGQGKTRLAAELAFGAAAAGWKVAVATYGPGTVHRPPGSQDLRLDDAAGVLLLVDYADRWPLTHLTWLFSNALLHRQVPARMLLLARSARPWPALRSTLLDRQADVSDQLLPPLPAGDKAGERVEMFAAARKNFAARYGITDPAVIAQISPPCPLEPGDFGITLAVHTAALVAVDAHTRHLRPPADPAGLTAYLLDRERRGWTNLYENRLEGLDFHTPPSVMARTVFTAILTGPASYRRGTEILTRLKMEGHPDRLLSDHAACYPPTAEDWVLEPLYPDRLAEDFLALSLPGHALTAYPAEPWSAAAAALLASRDDEGIPPPYIARIITFLAAAAAPGRWPHVSTYLNALLSTDPSLAIAAGGAALTALAEAVDMDVLETIEAHLPSGRHVDLDPAAAVIASRLHARRLAADDSEYQRAGLQAHLGYRLANASRYEEALVPFGEAAEIYRSHAAMPFGGLSMFGPGLAGSLNDLGMALRVLGRREEALAAAGEATEIYRGLAAAQPDEFEPGLAGSLSNLGIALSGVGRAEDALAATWEATEIRGRLAAAQPDAFKPGLAGSLSNLGMMLSGLGRAEDALAATWGAARIYRELAAAQPDAFKPDLAASLNNLGESLRALRRREEALAAAGEATEIYRELAAARPDAFEPDLAGSLSNLGASLWRLERREEALVAAREATEIRRELAAIRPDAFKPGLAASLTNLGMMLSGLERREEALVAAREATEIRRELAAIRPDAFKPGLAGSLSSLGGRLWELGRTEQALAATWEATEIYRGLAAARPDAFEPDLVRSLSNLRMMLSALGRAEEALAAAGEATEIGGRLAARPGLMRSDPT
jgi:tetratricopeptide (TPR) repeat protein